MVLVYPFGIPCLYMTLVYFHRHDIDPYLPQYRSEDHKKAMKENCDLVKDAIKCLDDEVKELEMQSNTKGQRVETKLADAREELKHRKTGDRPGKGTKFTDGVYWEGSKARSLDPATGTEAVEEAVLIRQDEGKLKYIEFLFDSYEPQCWWFEVYECIRRLMQTSLNVFIFPGTNVGLAVNIFFSFAFIKIQGHFNPFLDGEEDFLGELSQWLILAQLQMTLLLSTAVVEAEGGVGILFFCLSATLFVAVVVIIGKTMAHHFMGAYEESKENFKALVVCVRDVVRPAALMAVFGVKSSAKISGDGDADAPKDSGAVSSASPSSPSPATPAASSDLDSNEENSRSSSSSSSTESGWTKRSVYASPSVAWSEEPDVAFWARLPPSLSVADTHEDIVLKMTGRPRPVEAAAAAAAAASPAGVSSVADDSLSAVSVSVSEFAGGGEDKDPAGD